MEFQTGKVAPKKVRANYFYSIISISLVLFMLGLLGMIILHARQLSDYFRENIQVSVILRDKAREADILLLLNQLNAEPFIKSSKYVTKEEAAEIFMKEYDEDFREFLGFNPLYASIDIFLKAAYANEDSIRVIETAVLKNPVVKEIYYHKGLIAAINRNARKIGIALLAASILLLFVAITAIDSTIRLAMYSNRFLIKSMQLVGATQWFITRPFITKGIINGFISGILAIFTLAGSLYYLEKNIPGLSELRNVEKLAFLLASILLLGILISLYSTQRSVRKYLRMKLENLY